LSAPTHAHAPFPRADDANDPIGFFVPNPANDPIGFGFVVVVSFFARPIGVFFFF
jgi:hypothetical protein